MAKLSKPKDVKVGKGKRVSVPNRGAMTKTFRGK